MRVRKKDDELNGFFSVTFSERSFTLLAVDVEEDNDDVGKSSESRNARDVTA